MNCAVVAASSGDGLSELFGQLGVQGVVTGGQTLNPSTAELLAAVEAVNSNEVVVLPNNKNIIPVAQQLDALTTKTVRVVPTETMPEALSALIVYDPEADAEANLEEMISASDSVASGEITQAVRATQAEVGAINKDDWIGLVRGAPHLPVLASGGLQSGIDIAKCIALGASAGGIARPFLKASCCRRPTRSLDRTRYGNHGVCRHLRRRTDRCRSCCHRRCHCRHFRAHCTGCWPSKSPR